MSRRLPGFLCAALLTVLAACGTARPPPPPPSPPPPPVDAATACLAGLTARGIVFERVPDFHTPEGCGIDQAVRVDRSAIPWNRPALMTCSMAATLWEFETKVVQPAARQILKRKVTKIWHAGTYACRGERGGDPHRLSEHAFGKAIDVTGFELDDGTTIRILTDWRGKGKTSEFLYAVAQGACGLFSVVITPNRNAFHSDHIHMDIGPYKLCGM